MAAAVLGLRPLLLRAYGAAWAVTILAALLVRAVPGGQHAVAAWFSADLSAQGNPAPTAGRALGVAAHNLQVFAVPFALGLSGLGRSRLRPLVDAAIGLDVVIQAGLVGAAIGAYGTRIAAFLPHLPFEWLGLAAGLAAWLGARRGTQPREHAAQLIWLAAVAMTALLISGFLETYATPHR